VAVQVCLYVLFRFGSIVSWLAVICWFGSMFGCDMLVGWLAGLALCMFCSGLAGWLVQLVCLYVCSVQVWLVGWLAGLAGYDGCMYVALAGLAVCMLLLWLVVNGCCCMALAGFGGILKHKWVVKKLIYLMCSICWLEIELCPMIL
jgi:hypothetical protein